MTQLEAVQPLRERNLQRVWKFLAIALLTLGILLRFTHLDQKIYGLDETFTSLRISGYSEAEVVKDLQDTRVLTNEYIQRFQRYDPNKTMLGTINGLAAEEPQHPPLYYVVTRVWAKYLGSSASSIRTLSAIISLFAFPCIYWLCMELFHSHLTGIISVIFLAVSPFHLAYAQEARQYGLWTVMILLTSVLLLRAIRLRNLTSWALFTISTALSFYTFLLSVLVVAGQSFYVLFCGDRLISDRPQKQENQNLLRPFLLSASASILLFLPWVVVVVSNWSRVQDTVNFTDAPEDQGIPSRLSHIGQLLIGWTRLPGHIFFNLNISGDESAVFKLLQTSFNFLTLLVFLYSIYFLLRTTKRQTWLFIFCLIGCTGIGLLLQDVLIGGQGGQASTIPRYIVPTFLGIQLSIAHFFAYQINNTLLSRINRLFITLLLGIVILGGVFSCGVYSSSTVWWNKGGTAFLRAHIDASKTINEAPQPLVINDCDTWGVLFTSHLLKPEVALLTKPYCFSCNLQTTPGFNSLSASDLDQYNNIFLYPNPSNQLLGQVKEKQKYKLTPFPQRNSTFYGS